MDSNDDKDEKRRVMTPPAEWGGDEGTDGFLDGDAGWLSEPDDSPQDEGNTPSGDGEDTSDAGAALELTPLEEAEAAKEPSATTTQSTSAPTTDDSDLGWLTSGDLALTVDDAEDEPESLAEPLEEPLDTEPEPAEASSGADTAARTPPSPPPPQSASTSVEAGSNPITDPVADTANAAPDEPEDDDNWLDDAGDLAMAPPEDDEPESGVTDSTLDVNLDTGFGVALGDSPDTDGSADDNGNSEQARHDAGVFTIEDAPEPAAIDEPAPTAEPAPLAATASDDQDNTGWISEPDESDNDPVLPPAPPTSASEALLTDHKVAEEMPNRRLPLWPVVAVVIALILVGAGGWGAYTERTQLQSRVAELEGQLGRMRQQGDLSPEQEQALRSDNQSLRLQLATLREQYAGMAAEIESLEQRMLNVNATPDVDSADTAGTRLATDPQLAADADAPELPAPMTEPTQPVTASPQEPPPEAASAATIRSAASGPALPTTTEDGSWFVNIASYSRLDIAEEWANRVRQVADHVALQDIEVNGKTLHRVRVLGFASKADAQTAAKTLENRYNTGPLWIGEVDPTESAAPMPRATSVQSNTSSTTDMPKEPAVQAEPVSLKPTSASGGWFIYVDTYSRGVDADSKAKEIGDAGYEAKVAVEYRSGELFYRVQVVGIESREAGERITEELAALGDMPNLQLRQY